MKRITAIQCAASFAILLGSTAVKAYDFGGDIRINEVMTHTDEPYVDAVELYNQGDRKVDLDGWYLTDRRSLKKSKAYKIKNLKLDPGEYYTFRIGEDEEVEKFALRAAGDEIALFDKRSNRQDYLRLGTFRHDTSYGRVVTSEGEVELVALSKLTMDAGKKGKYRSGPNARPLIGPLVITEIMYAPDSSGRQFIEIKNVSDDDVSLDTHNGRFRVTGIDFRFPKDSEIDAGETIVLAYGRRDSSSEEDNARSDLGLSRRTKVYIFTEKLGSSGDIAIQGSEKFSPNDPGDERDPNTYYWDIDRVRYNSRTPWPRASEGYSIVKRNSNSFGLEPQSWDLSFSKGGTPGFQD